MTNDNEQTTTNDIKTAAFGARLKSARESIGLERKDAAAQLRLSEKIITMLEKESYPDDLPITFIRGYIRSYGKLLQIPELEITRALEPIQPKKTEADPLTLAKTPVTVTSSNYFMQLSTYLVILTVAALLGIWWYSHTSTPTPPAENKMLALPPTASTPTDSSAPGANNNASPAAPMIAPAAPEGQPQKNAAPAVPEAKQPINPKPETVAKQPSPQNEDTSNDDDDYQDGE